MNEIASVNERRNTFLDLKLINIYQYQDKNQYKLRRNQFEKAIPDCITSMIFLNL